MSRILTPRSSLENLKREAKRWLAALRAGDPGPRARLERALAPSPAPPDPTLRQVQLALAREFGFAGWADLKRELARRAAGAPVASPDEATPAFLGAAERGDPEAVRAFLDAHPDLVNARGVLPGHDGRRTALHFAMNRGSEAVAALLLERGADPNVRDDGDNAMPLHFAAEQGRLGLVRLLIEHGADPIGSGDLHELDVIGWATVFARGANRDVIDHLLAHGARHNIFSAVATGAAGAIRAITQRSPAERDRPMDATNHRRRPLHLAIVTRQPAALDALLASGADPEARDAAGLTALDQAALSGESDMAARLITAGATVHLPAAVALERADDVARLLLEEPDALRPGGRWDRLLIRAAERGSAHVIEALVRSGASVHARDDHRTAVDGTHGYTALHAAAFGGHADAVRTLLRLGADPGDREDKYWGTPAGWANYAGHGAVRDLILDGPIDLFDAIEFGRTARIDEILAVDAPALERRFGEYVNGNRAPRPWLDPAWTPLAYAVAHGRGPAVRALLARGARLDARDSSGRAVPEVAAAHGDREVTALLAEAGLAPPHPARAGGPGSRAAEFLRAACLDWRVGGSARAFAGSDAARLLERHPEIARADIYTAAVCGDAEMVRGLLRAHPERASAIGGPRHWPPLLYLCSARLPRGRWSDAAVEIAAMLLDAGADPAAFYLGGNADIHYTALTCVLGRGEDMGSMHPRARQLTRLLLERGADPHDSQVLYNVFADNTSRHLLDDDIVWLLELMHEHSVRRGHRRHWEDPEWPMFDMRGAPSLGDEAHRHPGARFMLEAAVDRNLLGMAEWLLTHGAGPNTPAGSLWKGSPRTLYEEARSRGFAAMAELLARYGAHRAAPPREGYEAFADACRAGEPERARALLAAHPEYGRDPRTLLEAARRDDVETISLLLDLGLEPGAAESRGGATALHLAAAADAVHAAALLIDRGAAIDARDRMYDGTPLGWATYFLHARTSELLAGHSRDVFALVRNGFVARLRDVLREEPARARVTSREGLTPLMCLPAEDARALEVARLLLDHGADPAARDPQGRTAADIAADRGLDEVAALLRAGPSAV